MIINAKTFRISRKDQHNIILERHVIRTKKDGSNEKYDDWENMGYYGKWEDLIKYLINSKIDIPKGSNLLEQLPQILEGIQQVELSILEEIKASFNGEKDAAKAYEDTKE